jgi:uncharacterized glyoxalase superfamily protein PhnB
MPQKATSAVPKGMHTITPNLWFNGQCKSDIEFYEKAFNAKKMGQVSYDPTGKIVYHAMLTIGDSSLMVADAWGEGVEMGPEEYTTMGLWLYVDDCDAAYERALQAGCQEVMPMMDCFWGDRMGKLIDPFGHVWAIASQKLIMSEEETLEAKKAWESSIADHEHHEGCC